MSIETRVLTRVKPSRKEEARLESFLEKLLAVAHRVSGLECIPCGSIGKGTWLSGDHDIDLFMLFPKETTRQELERRGLAFGQTIARQLRGKTVVKYAEHPYTQIIVNRYLVDVVPCYNIQKSESILSAVDRSPLHLAYVQETLVHKDDARLLKQFCKGIGVYGSDARHEGFSGYICELLVVKYGSFHGVLSAASVWNPPVRVALVEPSHAFQRAPLVVVDPVDATRNAAANVNEENLIRFISASKKYLKKPSLRFFFGPPKKPLSRQQLRALEERGTTFVSLVMKKPDVIDDMLYPQARRALRRLVGALESSGFSVMHSYECVGKRLCLVVELNVAALPVVEKMVGPPVYAHQHSEEFVNKYRRNRLIVEGERWVAEKPRACRTAESLLASFARGSVRYLEAAGIPETIAKCMARCTIVTGIRPLARDRDVSAFLAEKYFSSLA